MKPCQVCGEVKPLDEYHLRAKAPDGRQYRCKSCVKAYYKANSKTMLAQSAKRHSANREARLKLMAAYRAANPEAKRERDKAYYLKTRDQRIEQVRKYSTQKQSDRDPKYLETRRRNTARRRARLAKADTREFTAKDWAGILRRQDDRCIYCGVVSKLQIEHLIPVARGGRHAIGNIVAACGPCNRSKFSRLPVEFRLYQLAAA